LQVNHGLVVFDLGPHPGSVLWHWPTGAREELRVYTATGLEHASVAENHGWAQMRERGIGGVRPFPTVPGYMDYVEEYGRYRPRNELVFVRMLDQFVGRATLSLVAPPSITDEQAVKVLEHINGLPHEISEGFDWAAISDEPIAHLVQSTPVPVRWLYLLGLTNKQVFTVFLAEDPLIVNDFERHACKYPEFRVRERW
jgi:hypothetical protein